MRRLFWAFAVFVAAVGTSSAQAQLSISVGTYGHRPYYGRGFYYDAYPRYYRPVVVRPYYAPPVYGPVIIQEPAYVPERVVIERVPVVQQYSAPVEQVQVQPTHRVPDAPPSNATESGPSLSPVKQPGAPPPPVPSLPNSSATSNYRPQVQEDSEAPSLGRPVIPAPQQNRRSAPPASNVALKFKGKLPSGPTKSFYVTHKLTNQPFEIQIPANMEPREIRFLRSRISIKYAHGDIDIEFERDGSAKVDYDF